MEKFIIFVIFRENYQGRNGYWVFGAPPNNFHLLGNYGGVPPNYCHFPQPNNSIMRFRTGGAHGADGGNGLWIRAASAGVAFSITLYDFCIYGKHFFTIRAKGGNVTGSVEIAP